MESPRTARCTRPTPTRDSCTANSSRQNAHTKAESPGADRHRASQTPSPRLSARAPTELPTTSPSPDSFRKSPRSSSPDTRSPTKIRHPPSARSPPAPPPNSPKPLEPLRSFPPPSVSGSCAKSHRSTPAHRGQSTLECGGSAAALMVVAQLQSLPYKPSVPKTSHAPLASNPLSHLLYY